MRIVHTSDWHLGKIVSEYSMLEDQRYILHQLIQFLQDFRADVLLISGDLYDRSIPGADAVRLADEILSEIASHHISVFLIAGNHDSPERLSFLSGLLSVEGIYIAGMPEIPVRRVTLEDSFGPVHFFLLPYLEPGDLRPLFPDRVHTYDEAIGAVAETFLPSLQKDERNILLAHGFFSYVGKDGQPVDPAVFSASETSLGGTDLVNAARFSCFDYAAFGHLHAPQQTGFPHMRYSGSLLKYSASEAGQKKSVTCIELCEKGNCTITQHSLSPLRDLRMIQGNFSDLCRYGRESDPHPEDYIYAVLTDPAPILDGALLLKSVFPNLMGLRYEQDLFTGQENLLSAEAIRQKSQTDLFGAFYLSLTGEPLSPDQQALFEDVLHTVRRTEHEKEGY
ncbi:MAG TPA: exonuclease SbcCD subunit D [Firmicutes bacterium]|nr:exonuclease SbcCD subunit D [Bacillota bacterium]